VNSALEGKPAQAQENKGVQGCGHHLPARRRREKSAFPPISLKKRLRMFGLVRKYRLTEAAQTAAVDGTAVTR